MVPEEPLTPGVQRKHFVSVSETPGHSPSVITFAVRLAVPDKTRTRLVQELLAVRTLETGSVPLQVRSHP